MSHFLQNLLDRHQQGDGHQEASHIVQPRPKARFETDSGTGAFAQNDLANSSDYSQINSPESDSGLTLTRSYPDHGPTATDPSKQSSLGTKISEQHNIDKPVNKNGSSYRLDDLNERIAALTFQLGQKLPVQESPVIRVTENNNIQEISDQTELTEISEQFNSRNLSITGELNQRIQSIQNRFNSQQLQRTDARRTIEPQREQSPSNSLPNGKEQLPLMPETPLDFPDPAVKEKKQSIESHSENRISEQAGVLQIPSWLTELQADLNKRFQEVNTKPETEPVVNVTIGRVEVRAVQAEVAKPSKQKNKPSGVMSLDDYLNQRESRG